MNNLPAHQTQLLAVVQHGVEVLYPGGVSWTIQNDPLPLLAGGGGHVSEGGGQDSVTPLVRGGVKTSVQLSHGDALGVDDGGDHLELVMFRYLHVRQSAESLRQDVVRLGLAAHGFPYHHDTMTNIQHRVQLRNLLHEPVRGLEIMLGA